MYISDFKLEHRLSQVHVEMRLRNAKFYCKMLFKNATCLHQLLVFLMIQYVTFNDKFSTFTSVYNRIIFFIYESPEWTR